MSEGEMIKMFKRHKMYENETYAFEENRDAIFIGSKKVMKSLVGHYFAQSYEAASKIFTTVDGTRGFPLSWLTARTNYFIDSLNDFLLQSEQHGFTQHFYDSQFEEVPSLPTSEKINQISTYALSAGFIIWLATVLIACIVFILEHIFAYYKRNQK